MLFFVFLSAVAMLVVRTQHRDILTVVVATSSALIQLVMVSAHLSSLWSRLLHPPIRDVTQRSVVLKNPTVIMIAKVHRSVHLLNDIA